MSAPLVLHLMRHGPPVAPGLMIGHHDAPVAPAGVAACVAQATRLDFAAIVASDLARAADCAQAVAAQRGLVVTRDARWRELAFGDWEGRAVAAIDPAAYAAFCDDPDAAPPPGGERFSDLRARVAAALEAITTPTLVVAHAGSIRTALSLLCGFDHRQVWAIDLPYASVVSLRLWREPSPVAQITRLSPCAD